jgi:hypothetical protein
MSLPIPITQYSDPVSYTPRHIITNGLPPQYLPYRITPEVDNYFNLLKGLKRRGMNQRAAQLQANDNYDLKDWIAQEESRGIDLSEWLSKQGYNRSRGGGQLRKRRQMRKTRQMQRQRKSRKTRRV